MNQAFVIAFGAAILALALNVLWVLLLNNVSTNAFAKKWHTWVCTFSLVVLAGVLIPLFLLFIDVRDTFTILRGG